MLLLFYGTSSNISFMHRSMGKVKAKFCCFWATLNDARDPATSPSGTAETGGGAAPAGRRFK
jgi:hypothetical protein